MTRRRVVVIVSLLAMMGPFTSNIVIPSLPSIAGNLRTTTADTQLILSVYMAGFAVGQLLVGPLSDRFGRRPVLALSLALSMLASIGGALSHDLTALVISRLVQALGLSATLSIGRAVVRDMFPSERMARMYAYVGTALALGPILGPVVGGIAEISWGWRGVFWCMAGFGCAMFLIILFLLQETNRHPDPRALRFGSLIDGYRLLLGSKHYLGYALSNAIAYGGIFAFASTSSQILIGMLGVASDLFGLLFALTIGSYGIGTLGASLLTMRYGIDRMIVSGGLIMSASGLLMVVLSILESFTVWSVIGPFALFAFGTGFVFPNGQAGAISPFPERAGSASSMLSFLQMTLAAVVGAMAARILGDDALSLAWITFLMGVLLLLCFYFLVLRPDANARP